MYCNTYRNAKKIDSFYIRSRFKAYFLINCSIRLIGFFVSKEPTTGTFLPSHTKSTLPNPSGRLSPRGISVLYHLLYALYRNRDASIPLRHTPGRNGELDRYIRSNGKSAGSAPTSLRLVIFNSLICI